MSSIYIYIYIYIYMELLVKPKILTSYSICVDLRLAELKAVSFYLLYNLSTLNQCRKFHVSQLCVNTLPATKVTLITDGI
jgi:hypothetical protein